MKANFLTLAVALASGMAPVAFADVVPPELPECPAGSTGAYSHTGNYCRPTTCTQDKDCSVNGTVCRDVSACMSTRSAGGRVPPDATYTFDVLDSLCPTSGVCSDGKGCRSVRLCVPANSTAANTSTATATSTSTSATATATSTGTGTSSASSTQTNTGAGSTGTGTGSMSTGGATASATETGTGSITSSASGTGTGSLSTSVNTDTGTPDAGSQAKLAGNKGCDCSLGRPSLSSAISMLMLIAWLALCLRRRGHK